jgi:pilus assembly protein Flp/PilA
LASANFAGGLSGFEQKLPMLHVVPPPSWNHLHILERGKLSMNKIFARFIKDESGATAIEYGLIAGLIAVAIIGALTTLGTNLGSKFNAVASNLT